MSDLRKQLLQAGLVKKGQAQQVATEERKKKKKKKKKKKGGATEGAQAPLDAQREAYEARLRDQAEADRAREAGRNEARKAKEAADRVRMIIDRSIVKGWNKPGQRRFYFQTQGPVIEHFYLRDEMAQRVIDGAVAIVERPGELGSSFVVVDRNCLERLREIDGRYVRFANDARPGEDE